MDDDHIRDILDRHNLVAPRLIEFDGVNVADDRVLLHIQLHHAVAGVFKKLPHHADRHREAERDNRQIDRRELEGEMFALVEQIDQREADGRAQEAVDGMQHRVPMRHADIEAVQLAQYFSREDEQQDNHFQRGGQFDVQLAGKEARQNHQHQRQAAHEHALKITAQRRADEHENHQRAEHEIHRQRRLILIGGNFLFMFDVFLHYSLRLPFFSHYSTIYAAHVSFFRFSQPQTPARRF